MSVLLVEELSVEGGGLQWQSTVAERKVQWVLQLSVSLDELFPPTSQQGSLLLVVKSKPPPSLDYASRYACLFSLLHRI